MENLNKYLSSKIEPIHKSFISTKKVEQKELKCPNCGRTMDYYKSHTLKVMCGDKEEVRRRSSGRLRISEYSEHYIPVMVCENCFRKRKIAIIFIYILFLLVIPVFFFIKGGFAAGIVLFFIGLAISGYSSSLSEKLFISLDEALKIQKDQDAYGIDNIIDDM